MHKTNRHQASHFKATFLHYRCLWSASVKRFRKNEILQYSLRQFKERWYPGALVWPGQDQEASRKSGAKEQGVMGTPSLCFNWNLSWCLALILLKITNGSETAMFFLSSIIIYKILRLLAQNEGWERNPRNGRS